MFHTPQQHCLCDECGVLRDPRLLPRQRPSPLQHNSRHACTHSAPANALPLSPQAVHRSSQYWSACRAGAVKMEALGASWRPPKPLPLRRLGHSGCCDLRLPAEGGIHCVRYRGGRSSRRTWLCMCSGTRGPMRCYRFLFRMTWGKPVQAVALSTHACRPTATGLQTPSWSLHLCGKLALRLGLCW